MEYYKSVRSPPATRNCALHSAKEYPSGLTLSRFLSNRCQKVGAKNWKELANTCQKHLHVLTIGFRKLSAASLILVKGESLDLSCFTQKPGFKISHMSLCQIFVLA